MNKKGAATFNIFIFIFAIFFIAVFGGIVVLIFDLINDSLSIDVDVGQVNLEDINDQSFGKIANSIIDQADTYGIVIILGMAILMFMSAYLVGKEYPKLMIILDIFIIVFAFIISVYISQVYSTLINSSTTLDVYINDLPKTSTFILNLPIYISIIGVIIIILSYTNLRNKDLEESGSANVMGY